LDDDQRKQEKVMPHILLVALGGGLGAALRHLANMGALRLFGPNFPYGTMGINILGSFVMGVFIELLVRRAGSSNELRLFVATGILGGFTTFSAFSLDFAVLFERGAMGQALFYALASVILSILALFLGLWLVRTIAG
jgi:fluoride exporter